MVDLYHGTIEAILPSIEIGDSRLFDGLFFSDDQDAAGSHGPNVYAIEIDDADIATSYDLGQADFSEVRSIISVEANTEDDGLINELYDAITDDVGFKGAEPFVGRIATRSKCEPLADTAWELQRLRGRIAAALGYRAVEMEDEHGTSYLVVSC